MNRKRGALVGLALATIAVTALHAPFAAYGHLFLSLFLALTACVYLGALLAQSQTEWVAGAELAVGVAVFSCALLGAVTTSAAWLAGGYALHGVWDWLHDQEIVPTRVASWFPPACAVFDLVIAGFIVVFMGAWR